MSWFSRPAFLSLWHWIAVGRRNCRPSEGLCSGERGRVWGLRPGFPERAGKGPGLGVVVALAGALPLCTRLLSVSLASWPSERECSGEGGRRACARFAQSARAASAAAAAALCSCRPSLALLSP